MHIYIGINKIVLLRNCNGWNKTSSLVLENKKSLSQIGNNVMWGCYARKLVIGDSSKGFVDSHGVMGLDESEELIPGLFRYFRS